MKTGLEMFLKKEYQKYQGARLGLITNPSGVDSSLNSTIDLLYNHPQLKLKLLFGPEHGVRGNWQAGVKVENSIDRNTGLPVISLYGENRHLNPEHLADLDLIIYDIQDVGARYYTVIYTLAYALKAVKRAGKKLLIFDRPNPIAPLGTAGNIINEDWSSFVGGYQLPNIHGLTIGELAGFFNREFSIDADLDVIKMKGWSHNQWYEETRLPWIYSSPNMPTIDTTVLYPGTCLFEGTNLSEGRGTTKPFEVIGAPWISAKDWADNLNKLGLPGVLFRPVYFSPAFSKHKGGQLEGVQIHIIDRSEVEPIRTGVSMIISAFKNYPCCDWIENNGSYFIDKLAGGGDLREGVNRGQDYLEISRKWAGGLNEFNKLRHNYLLYD